MKPPKKAARSRRSTRAELEAELARVSAALGDRQGMLAEQASLSAQREMELSREHYVDLYDFAPVGQLALDRSGMIRSLNLAAAAMLGLPRGSLVGRPLTALVAKADQRRMLGLLSRARRDGCRTSIELELRRAEGPPAAVQMVALARSPEHSGGLHLMATLVDITDRKRAEARTAALAKLGQRLNSVEGPEDAARAVVDAAQEFCGWDACFVAVHDAATDTVTDLINMDIIKGERVAVPPLLLGRAPTPLMREVMAEGQRLILRQSDRDTGPITQRFGDITRAGLSLMFVPVRLEGKSIGVLSVQSYTRSAYTPQDLEALQGLADYVAGALARLQVQAALQQAKEQLEVRVAERTVELRQYQGHLAELVKQRTVELQMANEQLRREIAFRRIAERSLISTGEELKRSNRDLEQFASIASHDLQEPLRAVSGYLRLLERHLPGVLEPKAREYLASAKDGAVRMEKLIGDLLSFSRVTTSGEAFAPADLGRLLGEALQNLQPAIKAAKAKVTNDPLPRLVVDALQITRLFQNLIANAIKFRGERPAEVHVGARQEPGHWAFWVRDNGIGMAPQHHERIFRIFQRLHTQTEYPGTGMGLAICKRIVERHGGSIHVESKPGEGSTFYFFLADGAFANGADS